MENFDVNYATFYNLIYQDKDYKKEAAFIHKLLKQYSNQEYINSIKGLDLACGTGKHIFELEKLGLRLDGSDISASMINIAQRDAQAYNSRAILYNYAFQESDQIKNKYGYVISMFSSIDYLTSNKDLNRSFKNINGLLEDGGLFIFDCWNGNAVTRDHVPVRALKKTQGDKEIQRVSNTSLDLLEQVATVKFNCKYFEAGLKMIEFEEVHRMRYFYFEEMQNFLTTNNFELVDMSGFLSDSVVPDPYEWNITYIARKKRKEHV